jgi:ferredoxin-type protein NapH
MKGPGKRTVTLRKPGVEIHRLRNTRWAVNIGVTALFFLSYHLDIQVLEGTLSASRLLGFHLADPYATAQIVLTARQLPVNLLIGVVTIVAFYLVLGGRTYCSWVCPYHVLAEWGESLHHWLVQRKIATNHTFDYQLKYWIWVAFLLVALLSGYTVYEMISPPAVITRAAVYGTWSGLGFIAVLLLVEVLYSRRFWCRYVCPVGTTFNFIGRLAPLTIKWDQNQCTNCKECETVCMVPFVLADTVNRGRLEFVISGECTRCGLCVDACQDGALNFSTRYLDQIV